LGCFFRTTGELNGRTNLPIRYVTLGDLIDFIKKLDDLNQADRGCRFLQGGRCAGTSNKATTMTTATGAVF